MRNTLYLEFAGFVTRSVGSDIDAGAGSCLSAAFSTGADQTVAL
jgi:hypothetical protein